MNAEQQPAVAGPVKPTVRQRADDGGPAFPLTTPEWHEHLSDSGYPATGCDFTMGMTLRDYFAAKALPSIVAIAGAGQHTPREGMSTDDSMALDAYALADAMMRARAA